MKKDEEPGKSPSKRTRPRTRENDEKEVTDFEYDIAISYASEDREIADDLAEALRARSISVFHDKVFKHELWGKDLKDYFRAAYGPKTRFVIPLISQHFSIKDWTDFERKSYKELDKKIRTSLYIYTGYK